MKTALVTGGARRIGKAITLGLASRGFNIALHYNRSDPAKTLKEIEKKGVRAAGFRCDLARVEDARGLVERVLGGFGGLDVLVNCASVFEKGDIAGTDAALFDRHMAINIRAPFLLSRDFFRLAGEGVIINIIDAAVRRNSSSHAAYLLSKKALADFTLMAAREFAPRVRVNGVAPGFILPPRGRGRGGQPEKRIPLGRRGTPGEVAEAVIFLIENTFATGEIIYLDGGEYI